MFFSIITYFLKGFKKSSIYPNGLIYNNQKCKYIFYEYWIICFNATIQKFITLIVILYLIKFGELRKKSYNKIFPQFLIWDRKLY